MKNYFPIFILIGCAAIFIFGVVELFQLRFAQGDVYPAYSSLRADPLGTMALYESLEKIPGENVARDFSESDNLPEEPKTVYLHLAGDAYEFKWLSADSFNEIKNFLARGNRLVITFFPQMETYSEDAELNIETNAVKTSAQKNKNSKKPKKKIEKNKMNEAEFFSLFERWDLDVSFEKLSPDGDNYAPVRVVNQTALALPPALDWHSGLIFSNCDSAWKIIYARGTHPVVIERHFDKGSVVIATDSYFVSNEALAKDRHADLLAWLVGENKNIFFDEAHFGIVDTSGVATLMRKYRLHGLAAGLILLAGLFIWKNSTSLVPSRADALEENFVAGKDSASGFTNLLRRSISPRDLLATCFAEWKKSGAQTGKISSARFHQAETIFEAENSLPNKNRNAIGTYQKISEALGTRNQKL
jgi:hypothetical protein